jgi:Na+-driven multidrug efflux pump
MRQITPFGVIQVSAVGICHRLESFPYFVAQGFSIAATSLVGFYLGKHETKKIDKIVDSCLFLSSVIITPFMIFYIFLPHSLIELLSKDYLLIDAGAKYLYIIGVFEIFMCYENLMVGVFTGLGKTMPTTLVTMPLTIGRIPLAWFLATYLGWGISGIWWAISLSTFFKGFGLIVLYKYYKKKTNDFESLAI